MKFEKKKNQFTKHETQQNENANSSRDNIFSCILQILLRTILFSSYFLSLRFNVEESMSTFGLRDIIGDNSKEWK